MAGYIIHLAVGEEYLKNHPNEIKDKNSFFSGIISPDGVKDKTITHYGPSSSKVNLKNYLEHNNIKTDYDKGYFLHLITDYLFYNKFIKVLSKKILHEDYDYLNKDLKELFNVEIPSKIENRIYYKEGIPKILDLNSTITFIKNTAKYNLNDIKTSVLNNEKYFLEIKDLPKYQEKEEIK